MNACEFMPVDTFSESLLLPVYVCENVSVCVNMCLCIWRTLEKIDFSDLI